MCYAVGLGTWWVPQQKQHKPEHTVCVQVLDQNMNEEDAAAVSKKILVLLLIEQTRNFYGIDSIADPGCLSQIPDPDFYTFRIPDLGSRIQKQHQKRGMKKISCQTFFCSHKFHKIENYFIF